MQLNPYRSFFLGRTGFVVHDFLTLQPRGVVGANCPNLHLIPILFLQELGNVFGLNGVSLSRYVGGAGHILLQGTGYANLER